MLGREYHCSDCDFEFLSSWSHHVGGQFLVCRTCAMCVVLGGGTSCWGPTDGEYLAFVGEDGKQPATGEPVRVCAIGPAAGEMEDGISRLDFGPVRCPACGGDDALSQTLEVGEPCPKCRQGHVEDGGICIY